MRPRREQIHPPPGHSFRVLRWTRSLREVEVLFRPGAAAPTTGEGEHWHYHLEMELTHFSAGEGMRFVGDSIGHFEAGDLVLLGEKLPHYWHAEGLSRGLSVQWRFPESHPFWAFPENLQLAGLFESASRGLRYTGRTASALRPLLEELTRTSGPDQLGLLLRILATLASSPETDHRALSKRAISLPAGSRHQQAISGAVRHLTANFRDPIRLEDVLAITGMSKPTFCRHFKAHSGHTFSDFVTHLRLHASRRELMESDRPVIDIALACGFPTVSFFNRTFRRVLGCTPTAYRSRNKRAGKSARKR